MRSLSACHTSRLHPGHYERILALGTQNELDQWLQPAATEKQIEAQELYLQIEAGKST